MNISSAFIRTFFVLVSLLFVFPFAAVLPGVAGLWTYFWGAVLGLGAGVLLIGIDIVFKRFHLRSFNTVVLGLFFGYLMATALSLIFKAVLEMASIEVRNPFVDIIATFLFLFGTFLGVMMTSRASDEIYVSLPFVKFTPLAQKVKDILLDLSALNDPRIIDLASSGLLDKRLILPRFLLIEIQSQEEFGDDLAKHRTKKSLDIIKKLEAVPHLQLRYQDTDFPDVKEMSAKILRLARLLDADVLSAEIGRIQMAQTENVRIINIHSLSNALKPLTQRGEVLKIKIQRHGKEDRQGVGYLDDGTMVVVNGGGQYIGETTQASVLSVKHTTSGRIVFCNVTEGEGNKGYGDEEY